MEEACAEISLRLSVNCYVPGSSQTQRNATALTREMSTFRVGVFRVWLSSRMLELSDSGCCSISSKMVARMEVLGSDTGFSLLVVGKVILLNTQSINGL